MKISIVTAVLNRVDTIRHCIDSVQSQDFPNIEHIIVDGGSTDGTAQIAKEMLRPEDIWICERDNGIYDALNKGIKAATGDIVGFLHSDDFFACRSSLSRIATGFRDHDCAAAYGDLAYVDKRFGERITRFWKAGKFSKSKFYYGWMIPHPSLYVRRTVYLEKLGFRTDFSISADYESMIRYFVKNSLKAAYIPYVIVHMRSGGKSNVSLTNRMLANREDRRAWLVNDLVPPLCLRLLKPLRKLGQFARKK
jgi:glycosyltransferase